MKKSSFLKWQKDTDVSNNYTYNYGPKKYRQRTCVFQGLLKEIQEYCNCIPRYIDDIEDHIQEQADFFNKIYKIIPSAYLQPESMNVTDCSYYLHGVCISYIFNRYISDNSHCLPACNSFNFHVQSLQVSQISQHRPKWPDR